MLSEYQNFKESPKECNICFYATPKIYYRIKTLAIGIQKVSNNFTNKIKSIVWLTKPCTIFKNLQNHTVIFFIILACLNETSYSYILNPVPLNTIIKLSDGFCKSTFWVLAIFLASITKPFSITIMAYS